MRKIASLLVAAALVSTVSVSAMAADINEAEQAVLNELNGSVVMKGQKLVISEEYKNQAKNYFNTIDMTQEQSDNIVAELKRAEQLITEQGKGDAGNISEMLYAYLDSAHYVEKKELTEDQIKDLMYYWHIAEYIEIPEGFGENFKELIDNKDAVDAGSLLKCL